MELHLLYSQLPSVDRLLRMPEVQRLSVEHGLQQVTALLRELQCVARHHIQQQQNLPVWNDDWPTALQQRLNKAAMSGLQAVFNLTGTVLHTNLGRALLADSAIDAVTRVMREAVTLEYDLQKGERGHRDHALSTLLCQLTGAEAACVVNNNAAAMLLMLAAVAGNKEVIVSRGELVEIGGAFRLPDVMNQAGCNLVEVGCTNRTHLSDYRAALKPETGLLLKVHTSNYHIEGFTAAVSEAELVALGQEAGLPVAVDLGSGALIDMQAFGLPPEPQPQQLIASGVDLACFSGDKLLGGPQAGIIVGKRHWIDQIQQHPLKRALRVDKMTLAALEATLQLYRHPEKLRETLPTLCLLTKKQQEIRESADRLLPPLVVHYAEHFTLASEACCSQIGSGSLPVDRLPSWALTFTANDRRIKSLTALVEAWRFLPKPVIGRLQDNKLWLDLRCLDDETELLAVLTQ